MNFLLFRVLRTVTLTHAVFLQFPVSLFILQTWKPVASRRKGLADISCYRRTLTISVEGWDSSDWKQFVEAPKVRSDKKSKRSEVKSLESLRVAFRVQQTAPNFKTFP